MTLDGLPNLVPDDLGKHLERPAAEKRDDVLTHVVALVVEKTTDAYLTDGEKQNRPTG